MVYIAKETLNIIAIGQKKNKGMEYGSQDKLTFLSISQLTLPKHTNLLR